MRAEGAGPPIAEFVRPELDIGWTSDGPTLDGRLDEGEWSDAAYIGGLTQALGLGTLPFTFWGLVVGSVCYSMPFVVQPLQNAFASIGERPLEMAATLRSGPWDRFVHVVLPLARPGVVSASVLGFAHTLGEFGVVLMIGGNIPGETQLLSIALYDQVETMNYAAAHRLSLGLLLFSVALLFLLYRRDRGNHFALRT